jgi:undecaprenyl phosphate-alpha-L-ara4FN deformylase
MKDEELRQELSSGAEMLRQILGAPVKTSAAPGWRADNRLLRVKLGFPFDYDSDCRGEAPFYPLVDGEKLPRLQIPVTLPTYDEVLGRNGVTDENYNDFQLSLLKEESLNVLTVHAEAEGGRCSALFAAYMKRAIDRGYRFITMREAFELCRKNAPDAVMELSPFPGREGKLAVRK